MALRCTHIRDVAGFDRLRDEWGRLVDAASASLFMTWDWLRAWWTAYGEGRELRLIQLHDETGALTAIAPFVLDRLRTRPAGRFRALRLLGDGSFDSDYLDLLYARGRESEVVPAVFDEIERWRDWDVLLLHEVPDTSPTVAACEALGRQRRYRLHRDEVPCVYSPFDGDWDSFLGRLQSRFRSKVRSLLRAAEAEGARLEYCTDAATIDDWLDTLFALHTKRWERDGQPGVFGERRKREFYRTIAQRFLANDWLRLSRLVVGDQVVAMQFCFEYRHRTLLLQEGFDPDYPGGNGGNTLRAMVFVDNMRRGIVEYDFLAGVSRHKLNWAGEVRNNVRLTLTRPTMRGRLYWCLTDGVERGKDLIRAVVPESVIQRGKRMLGAKPVE